MKTKQNSKYFDRDYMAIFDEGDEAAFEAENAVQKLLGRNIDELLSSVFG
jgi:hypothetical protein